MNAVRVREVGYDNYWQYDGRNMVDISSLIASEREEIAYEIHLHTEIMFYCSTCGCHMKTFVDRFTKCGRCRRKYVKNTKTN